MPERRDWFKDEREVECIPLFELMDILNEETRDDLIGLPVFQRDMVWDDGRVELLWDSLLRGFPVGTLLFVQAGPELVRPLQESSAEYPKLAVEDQAIKWLLIDGQQRCAAIRLGGLIPIEEECHVKLWIDFGTASSVDVEFSLHLCTRAHPW